MKKHSILLLAVSFLLFFNCESHDPVCFLPTPTFAVNGATATDQTMTVDILTNGALNLSTQEIEGYTFHWSGPNNFESDGAEVVIPNATNALSGQYKLTLKKGICTGEMATNIEVHAVSLPCTPMVNKLTFSGDLNLTPVSFNSIYTSTNSGYFEITAGGSNGDLTIEFASDEHPKTGVYTINTDCPTSSLTAGQVCMSLVYSGHYSIGDEGNIYVTKLDNGNYEVLFCDILFNSSFPFELRGSTQIKEQ